MYPIHFSTIFNQNNLLKYIHSDKKNIKHIIDKLNHISNINNSLNGICQGLTHQYIAYENNHQGSQFIQQLNSVINLAKLDVPSDDPLQDANNQAWKQLSAHVAQQHAIDAIRLQANHEQSHYYFSQQTRLKRAHLAPKYPSETNWQYIECCLTALKNDIDMQKYYGISAAQECNLIRALYHKIKCGEKIILPEFNLLTPEINKKIKQGDSLTETEVKLFLQDAYKYCALVCEFDSTLFNVKSGLKYNKTESDFSYKNTQQSIVTATVQDIETFINAIIQNQQNCSISYSAHHHATAITIRYDPQNKRHSLSYFDPNEGVINLTSKQHLLDTLRILPKNTHIKNDGKIIETADIGKFIPIADPSNKLKLPDLEKEVEKLTKQLLVGKKTTLTLSNKNRLSFIEYDKKNDFLFLELKMEKECYQIISEYRSLNDTIKLIESTKSEYQCYQNKNIYIDWKGRIANRIAFNS
ncbi:hypothetical protein NVI2019_PEGOAJLN_01266 [Providencia alcalifaciens]|uniref:hypothetical protein n=1 Tax=Providencia alcalifaciens TaxID=126385 RepID=UPI0012B58D69|nr:hypothetical protein [Providencia alcalifaciens]MTC38528.1 hypothetical protein [Providencia alcalifaciens]CAG9415734.1 hypothetical protein NVI2019_PEGOAJLN_01266 [Providencia alcalifaciens]